MIEKRKQFLDFIKKMKLPVATIDEIAKQKEALMLVSRVEDYDLKNNEVFGIEENKSFPWEGLNCFKCQSPCVMSNGLYKAFKANPNNPRVVCGRCAFQGIKK